ncbi:ABC transporter membrane protein [Deinococcus aerolatus]|uniref:ABC transporter membrane protein n=1 Tax=Deinococcus aerolatus TaxID=522487 RepID=A0ABQ2G8E4_9DEIO|nr:ABC transporter permease subunit [Deinococcus aerolatus]GGL79780.1 ABC transporter membrane protein [Deinococcus aerolatus]
MNRSLKVTLGVGLGVSATLPLALLVLWSVAGRWYYPAALPTEWSLRAWQSVFAPTSQVWSALWGSVWVATVTAVLGTAIALPAARVLGLGQVKKRGRLSALLLAPLVLPSFASVMGIQVMFIRLGLADTRPGVVLAHLIPVVPYAVVLLSGVFGSYDTRLEVVARSLGANRWQVFWRVTLPVVMPGVLVSVLFAFLVSWSEYLLTLIVGGGQVLTLPLLLFSAVQGGDYAITGALSLLYIAPTLLVFALIAPRVQGWRT